MFTYKCNRKSKIFVTKKQLYQRVEKEINEIASYLNLSSENEI